jgi:hypothetical protein
VIGRHSGTTHSLAVRLIVLTRIAQRTLAHISSYVVCVHLRRFPPASVVCFGLAQEERNSDELNERHHVNPAHPQVSLSNVCPKIIQN